MEVVEEPKAYTWDLKWRENFMEIYEYQSARMKDSHHTLAFIML